MIDVTRALAIKAKKFYEEIEGNVQFSHTRAQSHCPFADISPTKIVIIWPPSSPFL